MAPGNLPALRSTQRSLETHHNKPYSWFFFDTHKSRVLEDWVLQLCLKQHLGKLQTLVLRQSSEVLGAGCTMFTAAMSSSALLGGFWPKFLAILLYFPPSALVPPPAVLT